MLLWTQLVENSENLCCLMALCRTNAASMQGVWRGAVVLCQSPRGVTAATMVRMAFLLVHLVPLHRGQAVFCWRRRDRGLAGNRVTVVARDLRLSSIFLSADSIIQEVQSDFCISNAGVLPLLDQMSFQDVAILFRRSRSGRHIEKRKC